MTKKKKDIKEMNISNEKLCALLSYFFIGIIWYLADKEMKKSSFTRFHAKQGLIFLIADIIFWVIMSVPLIGWLITPVLYVILVIFLILGIINVATNKEKELPIIGKFAKNFNF